MSKKERESGRKWDGVSRVSTNKYKENWNDIFKKEKKEEPDEPKTRLEQMTKLTHDPIID